MKYLYFFHHVNSDLTLYSYLRSLYIYLKPWFSTYAQLCLWTSLCFGASDVYFQHFFISYIFPCLYAVIWFWALDFINYSVSCQSQILNEMLTKEYVTCEIELCTLSRLVTHLSPTQWVPTISALIQAQRRYNHATTHTSPCVYASCHEEEKDLEQIAKQYSYSSSTNSQRPNYYWMMNMERRFLSYGLQLRITTKFS